MRRISDFRVPRRLLDNDAPGAGQLAEPSSQKSWINLLPALAASVAGIVGILVLLGWVLDVAPLRTLIPDTNPMVVSTAFCFVLIGASLWLLRDSEADMARRWAGRGFALAVASIGLLKLGEYAFGWDLGIDPTLLTKNAGPIPGQMALPSAIGFLLCGTALIVLDVETPRGWRPAQTLTLVGALFPLLALVGRLYGVPTLSSLLGGTVVMAIHTALTFAVVCAGILATRSDRGVARVFTSDGPGGFLLRGLLPAALGVVVLAGWVRLFGERSGFYEAEFGVALFAIFTLVLLTVLIGRTARSLYRADLERAVAVEKLKESEQRQQAVLASIGDGIVITDGDGVVVSINGAMERLAGWREEEVQGRQYEQAFPLLDPRGEELKEGQRFLARALSTGEVVASRGYNVFLLTRDSRRVPVSIGAAPILDRQGELLGGIDIIRDVSHEREVDQLKSSLVSTVSHELRTPLTLIQGYSELLITREVDEKSSREALEQIDASAKRLGRLIEDLLSVSRIESGRLEVRLEPVNVADTVEDVTALFGRDREVRIGFDNELPSVMADGELLIRILTNLLSNAVKYSPAESPISVSARSTDTSVEVSVSDEGIGMTKDETARLFEKFFRADHPEVRSAGGTGLGLYITRNLVEMQGGQIWAESERGRGTTFRFTLPLALRDAQMVSP